MALKLASIHWFNFRWQFWLNKIERNLKKQHIHWIDARMFGCHLKWTEVTRMVSNFQWFENISKIVHSLVEINKWMSTKWFVRFDTIWCFFSVTLDQISWVRPIINTYQICMTIYYKCKQTHKTSETFGASSIILNQDTF